MQLIEQKPKCNSMKANTHESVAAGVWAYQNVDIWTYGNMKMRAEENGCQRFIHDLCASHPRAGVYLRMHVHQAVILGPLTRIHGEGQYERNRANRTIFEVYKVSDSRKSCDTRLAHHG
jgi:hypothetical protein